MIHFSYKVFTSPQCWFCFRWLVNTLKGNKLGSFSWFYYKLGLQSWFRTHFEQNYVVLHIPFHYGKNRPYLKSIWQILLCRLRDCSHVELSNPIWHTKGKHYRLCKFNNQTSDKNFVLDLKEQFEGKYYYQFEICQKLFYNSSQNSSSKQNSILSFIFEG